MRLDEAVLFRKGGQAVRARVPFADLRTVGGQGALYGSGDPLAVGTPHGLRTDDQAAGGDGRQRPGTELNFKFVRLAVGPPRRNSRLG